MTVGRHLSDTYLFLFLGSVDIHAQHGPDVEDIGDGQLGEVDHDVILLVLRHFRCGGLHILLLLLARGGSG